MRPLQVAAVLLPLLLAASCGEAAGPDGARALERVKLQVAKGSRVSGTAGNTQGREGSAGGGARVWGGAGNTQGRECIAGERAGLGGKVERQSFADTVAGQVWPLVNVFGRFGPATGRRIALFAHFDTRPWCDEDPDPATRLTYCPGANDAGSGVSVLLEVAEQMHARGPAVGVDLVFLDGEDFGRP